MVVGWGSCCCKTLNFQGTVGGPEPTSEHEVLSGSRDFWGARRCVVVETVSMFFSISFECPWTPSFFCWDGRFSLLECPLDHFPLKLVLLEPISVAVHASKECVCWPTSTWCRGFFTFHGFFLGCNEVIVHDVKKGHIVAHAIVNLNGMSLINKEHMK